MFTCALLIREDQWIFNNIFSELRTQEATLGWETSINQLTTPIRSSSNEPKKKRWSHIMICQMGYYLNGEFLSWPTFPFKTFQQNPFNNSADKDWTNLLFQGLWFVSFNLSSNLICWKIFFDHPSSQPWAQHIMSFVDWCL